MLLVVSYVGRASFLLLEHLFPVFCFFRESDFVPGGPGIFAHALVPGQRDSGTRKYFFSGTKGQRANETSRPALSQDVPSLGNPTLTIG